MLKQKIKEYLKELYEINGNLDEGVVYFKSSLNKENELTVTFKVANDLSDLRNKLVRENKHASQKKPTRRSE